MKARFHMGKGGLMVEHDQRAALEKIRHDDPRFKRARIKHVIQAFPSQIQVGVVYVCGTEPPHPAALPWSWSQLGVGFWLGAGIPQGERVNTFVECGCCGAYHRTDFAGDCREDSERYWDLPEGAVLVDEN